MRTSWSALCCFVLALALGGCTSADEASDQGNSALFGLGDPEMKAAPLKATVIDGLGAIAANRDFVFASKTTGQGGANPTHELVRIRHGETSSETLVMLKGDRGAAIATDDALFVALFAESAWDVLRITKGAAPARLDAPQFPTAFARKGTNLLVAGQKDDRPGRGKGPDSGVLAFPLAGGASRMVIPQKEIDRVGGIGKRRVTHATVEEMQVVGNDVILGIQRTVDGSAQSGIVVAKAVGGSGTLQVLFDTDDADILNGMAVLGSDVWVTRSIAGGVIGSATAELVKIGLASGDTKRVKKPAYAVVSTGDRLFFNQDGDFDSLADPSTIQQHRRVPCTNTIVASPDGRRIYAGCLDETTRFDR